jgi:hypothetical protein
MNLPTTPSPAKRKNPKKLVIFGKPKCGKTEISAALTRMEGKKWLLLQLESGGGDFSSSVNIDVPAMVKEKNDPKYGALEAIVEIGTEIAAQGNPYDGIIVDTVTKLEELVGTLACQLYRGTPMGATWQGTDVRVLPKGAGYLYLRNAYFQVAQYIEGWAHNVIFLGHLSAKMIEKKGEEVISKELDLTGKLSTLVCADVDAIAYCYRKDNQTILNFNNDETSLCGSRCDHLSGSELVIAESDEMKNITTFWDKVYLPE